MNQQYIDILCQYFLRNSAWFFIALIVFAIMLIVELRKKKRSKQIKIDVIFIVILIGTIISPLY